MIKSDAIMLVGMAIMAFFYVRYYLKSQVTIATLNRRIKYLEGQKMWSADKFKPSRN